MSEDLYIILVAGFLLGLAGFGAGYVRVRRWTTRNGPPPATPAQADERYRPREPTQPSSPSLRGALDRLIAVDRVADLAAVLLVIAVLGYGAIVAPRLRYILLVAIITATMAWWVYRSVMKWVARK